MNKIYIDRNDKRLCDDEYYREILNRESHHDHKIINDNGVVRWEGNHVEWMFNHRRFNLIELTIVLETMGYGRNSEVYRKLYRNMGYTLRGYWEVFYWDVNNEDCDDYVGGKK